MKNNRLITLIVVILVIALTTVVISIVIDNKNDVNTGNYRVVDLVTTSSIGVRDNSDINTNLESLSDIKFLLNQNNKISILTTRNDNISKIYIDNINFKEPTKKGEMSISVLNSETKWPLENGIKELEIVPEIRNNQNYIEIDLNNEAFVQDLSILENEKSLKFDGTILEKYGIDIKDVSFDISFNLNILEKNGNLNVCNLSFTLPNEDLVLNGISVIRKDIQKINFKLN